MRHGNKAHLIALLEKIAVSLQASCFKENRDVSSIANQIMWQNRILVAFLETSGQLMLPIETRRTVNVAQIQQQNRNMLGRPQQFHVLQIKVALVSTKASHVASAKVDYATRLMAGISAVLIIKQLGRTIGYGATSLWLFQCSTMDGTSRMVSWITTVILTRAC